MKYALSSRRYAYAPLRPPVAVRMQMLNQRGHCTSHVAHPRIALYLERDRGLRSWENEGGRLAANN